MVGAAGFTHGNASTNVAFKMMHLVLEMMDFVFKMMDFANYGDASSRFARFCKYRVSAC